MRHQIKQAFEELKAGDFIKLSWSSNPLEITELDKEKELITGLHYEGTSPPDSFDTDPRIARTVMFYEYECTYVDTPDLRKALEKSASLSEDSWTACEIHYGVNHTGSQDPDPLRALALAVLRGDPDALGRMRKTLHKAHA